MEIDILIDELTACLIQRETGLIVETDYEERQSPIKFKDYNGWEFDWTIPDLLLLVNIVWMQVVMDMLHLQLRLI